MASFKEYLNQLCFDCISRLLETKFGDDLSWYRNKKKRINDWDKIK
jgi:hypothetical protein